MVYDRLLRESEIDDAYETLGVAADASNEDIAKAYKERAQQAQSDPNERAKLDKALKTVRDTREKAAKEKQQKQTQAKQPQSKKNYAIDDFNRWASASSLSYRNFAAANKSLITKSKHNVISIDIDSHTSLRVLIDRNKQLVKIQTASQRLTRNQSVSANDLNGLAAQDEDLRAFAKYYLESIDPDIARAAKTSNSYILAYSKDQNAKGAFIRAIPLNEPAEDKDTKLPQYDLRRLKLVRKDLLAKAYFSTVSDQELAGYFSQVEANYQMIVSKHPYATQVAQTFENELSGKKYTSVGASPWVREAIRSFMREKARLLESKSLREAGVDGKKMIDEIYGKPENLKWEERDFLDCINAARDGDQTAIGYIMYVMAPAIVASYWKNYVGPNTKLAKIKIDHDGGIKRSFLSWIGVALKTLILGGVATKRKNGDDRVKASTLDGFDETKVKGDLASAFAGLFRIDLTTQAVHLNREKVRRGIAGEDDSDLSFVDLDAISSEDGEKYAAKNDTNSNYEVGSVEDDVMESIGDSEFGDKWLDFCQDDELNKGKFPASKALKTLIQNPDATNMRELATEAGVARGTFQTYCEKAVSIMKDYDISYSDLMRAIDRYGKDKIASYLG